jgi:hypothetical protein
MTTIEDPGGRFPFDLNAIWSANPSPQAVYTVSMSASHDEQSGSAGYGWGGEVTMIASVGYSPVEEMIKAAARACVGWSPGEGFAPADRVTVNRYGHSRAILLDLGPKPEQQ